MSNSAIPNGDMEMGIPVSQNDNDDSQVSIYRIPVHVRKNKKNYYQPRMVSIGPYHHQKGEHLRGMEVHKMRYFTNFISKKNDLSYKCTSEMRPLEAEIRAHYFESVELHNDQFVMMMVLDSLFVLKLFINCYYKEKDEVLDVGWALPLLISDLLMLENQIPFFVLTKMFEIYKTVYNRPPDGAAEWPSLEKLVTDTLVSLYVIHDTSEAELENIKTRLGNPKHLLHLFYHLFLKEKPPVVVQDIQIKGPIVIPSAIELIELGITLKSRNKDSGTSFLSISFDRRHGILEVPTIIIDESNRSRLLNLIAFEQCSGDPDKPLASYATFMACLMNIREDVLVVERAGIIENNLVNSLECAKFFGQLRECAYIDVKNHYMKDLFVNIVEYSKQTWPTHRARLCREYFSSPWTIFSLFAALLILSMTTIQTVCAIIAT